MNNPTRSKLYFFIILIWIMALSFTGCVSQSEYERLNSDYNKLSSELNQLEADNSNLEESQSQSSEMTEEEIRNTIAVYDVLIEDINSAGGVSVEVYYNIKTDRQIKYLTFYAQPYNAVGDIEYSEIGGNSVVPLEVIGPIPKTQTQNTWVCIYDRFAQKWGYPFSFSPDSSLYVYHDPFSKTRIAECDLNSVAFCSDFENVWYNDVISSVKIVKIAIEFMDGESVVISEGNMKHAVEDVKFYPSPNNLLSNDIFISAFNKFCLEEPLTVSLSSSDETNLYMMYLYTNATNEYSVCTLCDKDSGQVKMILLSTQADSIKYNSNFSKCAVTLYAMLNQPSDVIKGNGFSVAMSNTNALAKFEASYTHQFNSADFPISYAKGNGIIAILFDLR